MNLNDLASLPNLTLAWRRVTSGLNIPYKARFRPILEAYELASRPALTDLRQRILAGAYDATIPLKLYYPKPSGLQRPITYLVIEDQIALQALANLFARAAIDDRRPLERTVVFSNYFNPPDSPFAVSQWWLSYGQMLERFDRLYRSGYNWVVKFDLSAFYDTIAHDLLLRTIAPRGGSRLLVERTSQWLKVWSSPTSTSRYSHGIPQGPIASDILAECFLLPIDRTMAQKFKYVRYVDDIRVFGKSEAEIRQATVLLDRLCRERGLIPHVGKFGAVRLRTLAELKGLAPRIDTYHGFVRSRQLPESQAWNGLLSSLDQTRRRIQDKTQFRYTLFRSPRSARILRLALRLWRSFPEHTDAFAAYLDQYVESRLIAASASELVRSPYPYDAVKGEQWKLLAKVSSRARMRALASHAIESVRDVAVGPATKMGALAFLCTLHVQGIGSYVSFLNWVETPLIQAFTARYLPIPISLVTRTAGHLLGRSVPDTSLALTRHLQVSGVDPRTLLSPRRRLNPIAELVFEEAGLMPPARRRHRDRFGLLLARRFRIPDWRNWRRLLGSEYPHAYSLLTTADAYYEAHYTPWLSQHDALNEIIFRQLQRHIHGVGAPGAVQTSQPSGELIRYGRLIRYSAFQTAYPILASALVDIHDRRNRLPTSHPYEERTGGRAAPLTRRERTFFWSRLARAYAQIIAISQRLGI